MDSASPPLETGATPESARGAADPRYDTLAQAIATITLPTTFDAVRTNGVHPISWTGGDLGIKPPPRRPPRRRPVIDTPAPSAAGVGCTSLR